MNLEEIKSAIAKGNSVRWSNTSYEVLDLHGEYLIVCKLNDHAIGLTWRDGKTLNGEESEFYIQPKTEKL